MVSGIDSGSEGTRAFVANHLPADILKIFCQRKPESFAKKRGNEEQLGNTRQIQRGQINLLGNEKRAYIAEKLQGHWKLNTVVSGRG